MVLVFATVPAAYGDGFILTPLAPSITATERDPVVLSFALANNTDHAVVLGERNISSGPALVEIHQIV